MIYCLLWKRQRHVSLEDVLDHQECVMKRRDEHVRLYMSTPGYARQPIASNKTRCQLALMRTSKKLYWEISDHFYRVLTLYVWIDKRFRKLVAGRILCWSNDCRDLPACVCCFFPFSKIRRLKVVISHPLGCSLDADGKYLEGFYRLRAKLLEASWLLHLFGMNEIFVKFEDVCHSGFSLTGQDERLGVMSPGRTDLKLMLEPLTLFWSEGCFKVQLTESQLDHPKAFEILSALENTVTSSQPVTKSDFAKIGEFHTDFRLTNASVFKDIEGTDALRAPADLEGRRQVIVTPLLYRLNCCVWTTAQSWMHSGVSLGRSENLLIHARMQLLLPHTGGSFLFLLR